MSFFNFINITDPLNSIIAFAIHFCYSSILYCKKTYWYDSLVFVLKYCSCIRCNPFYICFTLSLPSLNQKTWFTRKVSWASNAFPWDNSPVVCRRFSTLKAWLWTSLNRPNGSLPRQGSNNSWVCLGSRRLWGHSQYQVSEIELHALSKPSPI